MSTMRRSGVPLAVFVLAFAGTTAGAPAPFPKKERATEATALLGTWKQVFSGQEGKDRSEAELPFRNHWVITDSTITIFIRKQSGGGWKYRIDPSKKPATLDLTVVGGDTYPSIYQLEGDRLTVLIQSFPKRGRPRDINSWSDPGIGRHVYVRVKAIE